MGDGGIYKDGVARRGGREPRYPCHHDNGKSGCECPRVVFTYVCINRASSRTLYLSE